MLSYFLGGNDAVAEWNLSNHGLIVGRPLDRVPEIEEWMVSGGIGRLIRDRAAPDNVAETAIHEDIGPLLAYALQDCMASSSLRISDADETVRATVIGAGMQSTEIGGATVHLDPKLLPIRNLPVVKLEKPSDDDARTVGTWLETELEKTMTTALRLYDSEADPPLL